MRAGKLRHRVALQSYAATRDEYGSEVQTWATEDTFWCGRMPQSGREFENAQQRIGEIAEIFECRYRSDITLKKRLAWDGRQFDIKAFWNPDGRKQSLMIACVEHLGGGTQA